MDRVKLYCFNRSSVLFSSSIFLNASYCVCTVENPRAPCLHSLNESLIPNSKFLSASHSANIPTKEAAATGCLMKKNNRIAGLYVTKNGIVLCCVVYCPQTTYHSSSTLSRKPKRNSLHPAKLGKETRPTRVDRPQMPKYLKPSSTFPIGKSTSAPTFFSISRTSD